MVKDVKDTYCPHNASSQIRTPPDSLNSRANRLGIYTDRSGINGKMEAAVMWDQKILRAYMGKADLYKVCYSELYRILMATSSTNLIINIEIQCNITIAVIYTDDQVAIQKVQCGQWSA